MQAIVKPQSSIEQIQAVAPWLAERYVGQRPDRLARSAAALIALLGDALVRAGGGAPVADQTAVWDELDADDWALFGELAQGEGVAPLAYWEIEQAGRGDQLPAVVWNGLRETGMGLAVRNLRFFRALDDVLDRLATAGIGAIVLKGPALARTVYPNPLLRPMSDVDILVRSCDVAAAVDVLLQQGWTRHVLFSDAFQQVVGPNIPLRSPSGVTPSFLLEIHWVLIGTAYHRRAEPAEWAWGERVALPTGFSGLATQRPPEVLNPVACTLYLAAHAYLRHRYDDRSLLALWDIGRCATVALAAPDGEQRLIAAAAATGWAAPLRKALGDAAAAWQLALPPDLLPALQAIEDEDGRALLALKARPDASMTGDVALPLFHTLNWAGRLEFVRSTIWPSREYLAWRFAARPGRWTRLPLRARWWAQLGSDLAAFLIARRGRRGIPTENR